VNLNDIICISKTFDTVRHAMLFDKLSMSDIPDEAYNWKMNKKFRIGDVLGGPEWHMILRKCH